MDSVTAFDWARFGVQIAVMVFVLAALIFTAWQFVTRHRPLLGVEALRVDSDDVERGTRIILKNWGATKADRIETTIRYERPASLPGNQPNEPDIPRSSKPGIAIFPGQSVGIAYAAPDWVTRAWDASEKVRMRIDVTYWSPVPRPFANWKWFCHTFEGSYWLDVKETELLISHQ